MSHALALPDGVTVFERGWLSSNNVLFHGGSQAALVDSGYAVHAPQTVALVRQALGERALGLLVNTHLHSDHCGGNAALQDAFRTVRTLIPPGQAEQVRHWDPVALTYEPTGQQCPPFRMDGVLQPGSEITLGEKAWQVHGAPGHDPHSVVLFEPAERILISADALWENGFGVVFPELEGEQAFSEVDLTLKRIEAIRPRIVIPGHGRVFSGDAAVAASLANARRRLAKFVADPASHARHAAKVLLKFKLLELRRVPRAQLQQWAVATPYFALIRSRYFPGQEARELVGSLLDELVAVGAMAVAGGDLLNA